MKKGIVRGIIVRAFAALVYFFDTGEKGSNVASNETLSHREG